MMHVYAVYVCVEVCVCVHICVRICVIYGVKRTYVKSACKLECCAEHVEHVFGVEYVYELSGVVEERIDWFAYRA
jgi:hypothetical protein